MISRLAAQDVPMTQRIEQASGIRPVTLLIASGIALIIVILLATGVAMNHLREQALTTTESELGRIDSVLAQASDRSFSTVDAQLALIAQRLGQGASSGAAAFHDSASTAETGAMLRDDLTRFVRVQGLAVLDADGAVLSRAGTWPVGGSGLRDLVTELQGPDSKRSRLGAPIRDAQTGSAAIPMVRSIEDPSGRRVGALVAMVREAEVLSLFAAVPLPNDASIMLVRPDGSILARFPAVPGATVSPIVQDANIAVAFADNSATMVRNVAENGEWRIEAMRALAGYTAAVVVSRSAEQALAQWARQGFWFGGFAVIGAVLIGIVVYVIARQFKIHDDLAAMRADRIEAEKIEIERARLAAETELLKSERLSVLGQLTATVAHELRNPLSAIRNTLFTIKELATAAGTKLDRPIARMERSIERCDRIISDLLEYTRNRELNRRNVAFDHWLAEMLAEQSISPLVMLSSELGAGEAVVPIDPDRIRRVVINLVENAAQALAETAADREKRVTVRTIVADDELILRVEDTGPGIPAENLARIFEPLFSTKSFGTGLGLPTVKQIVNQHGGIIAVDSEVGEGTSVTVRLPLAAAATEEMMVAA